MFHSVMDSTAVFGSASGGSNPSGATRQGALDNPLSLGQWKACFLDSRLLADLADVGVCAGLKILRTWFDSTRLHNILGSAPAG